jgi:hypothetical protein
MRKIFCMMIIFLVTINSNTFSQKTASQSKTGINLSLKPEEVKKKIIPEITIKLPASLTSSTNNEISFVSAIIKNVNTANDVKLLRKGKIFVVSVSAIQEKGDFLINWKLTLDVGENDFEITAQNSDTSITQLFNIFYKRLKPPVLSLNIEPFEITLEPEQRKTIKFNVKNNGEEEAHDIYLNIIPKDSQNLINFQSNNSLGNLLPGHEKNIELSFIAPKEIRNQFLYYQVKTFAKNIDTAYMRSFSIKTIIDQTPPSIVIIEPTMDRKRAKTITEKSVTIRAKITDSSGISKVTMNGFILQSDSLDEYSKTFSLTEGINIITIEAYDNKLNKKDEVVVINYEPIQNTTAQIERKGKDYAILFATDNYDNWSTLLNPINDAKTISSELIKNYGFLTEVMENSSQAAIFSKLRQYALKNYEDDDQLLIFFAGHGFYDEIFKEGFIVASDSKANDEARISFISHNRLREVVNSIPCKHIFLMIDACFGGTFDPLIARLDRSGDEYTEVTKTEFIQRKLKFKTRKFLTSGGKEYVSDGKQGKFSPFVRKILDAVRSYGGKDGILTLGELIMFVEKIKPEPRFGEFGDNEPGSDFIFIAK